MIYTEYDPLETVIVGDTYTPDQVNNLLDKYNDHAPFNKITGRKPNRIWISWLTS